MSDSGTGESLRFTPRRPLLVLGASGQVGNRLVHQARQRYGDGAVQGTYQRHPSEGLIQADFADAEGLERIVLESEPGAVVISGAFAWVDGCESDPDRVRRVNVDAPAAVARACRQIDAAPVLLSTDYVFDGEDGPYREDQEMNPLNRYGASKQQAEEATLANEGQALVIRTTVVYSWDPGGNNFLMQVVQRLDKGQSLRLPVDQLNTPTYAPDLAQAILELLEHQASGVYNVAGPDALYRHEFALRIANLGGFPPPVMETLPSSELGAAAQRPLQGGLICQKFESLTGRKLVGVDEGVRLAMAARESGVTARIS